MSTVARLWSVANPSPRISKNLQESPIISKNLQRESDRRKSPKMQNINQLPAINHATGEEEEEEEEEEQQQFPRIRKLVANDDARWSEELLPFPRQPKFPRIQRMLQATPRGQSGSHFMPMLAAGPWAGSHTHTPTHARAHGDAHTQAHTHTHTHTHARTHAVD